MLLRVKIGLVAGALQAHGRKQSFFRVLATFEEAIFIHRVEVSDSHRARRQRLVIGPLPRVIRRRRSDRFFIRVRVQVGQIFDINGWGRRPLGIMHRVVGIGTVLYYGLRGWNFGRCFLPTTQRIVRLGKVFFGDDAVA